MKKLLYIGNKLSGTSKTITTIDALSGLFAKSGYQVTTASGINNKILRLLDMQWHIFKYRKKVDFVLIDTYSTQNFYFAYLSSLLCRIFNLKYIPILHGGNLPNRLKKSPKLSQAIFGFSYINVAPSLYTKSNFEKLGYQNTICIPNVIELKKYPFKKRSLEKIKMLWVRSFSKIYNPLLAIDVLKILQAYNKEVELCMVGPEVDGSLEKAKNYARDLGLRVKFTGKLSKEEWISLSEDYNVFINTTMVDNMPVSVIEAMALGLPVVSTNVGGIPFLITHDKDGILVPPNSSDAFVKAIDSLTVNPEKVSQITCAAREQVTQFDWQVVKEQWKILFK